MLSWPQQAVAAATTWLQMKVHWQMRLHLESPSEPTPLAHPLVSAMSGQVELAGAAEVAEAEE
jgi:hypothetical protein